MTAIRAALSLVSVLWVAGCASLRVQTDYDPQASFAQLGTYSWIDQTVEVGGNPAVNSTLVERRIRDAVDNALRRMGYGRVTTDSADFRVAYSIVSEQQSTVDARYGYGAYGYGSRLSYRYRGHSHFGYGRFGHGYDRHYDPYYGSSTVREYVEVTLVLDVVDAQTNQLIWRGWATDRLDHDPKPEAVSEYIQAAVWKILETFPPASLESRPRHIAP